MSSDALPFKPWRPKAEERARGLHRSPLDDRSMSVMEYYRVPDTRLDDIVGISRARDEVKKALMSGVRKLLITGPPKTGKSILALAAASTMGKPIIDVDISRISPKDIGLIDDLADYISKEDFTLITYNIDSYIATNASRSAGRIIIYDPYSDLKAQSELENKLIIYDPYTDNEHIMKAAEGLGEIIGKLAGSARRFIATAVHSWLLPPQVREIFEVKVEVEPPNPEEREAILRRILKASVSPESMRQLVAATRGCTVGNLIEIAGMINESSNIMDVLFKYECYAEKYVKSMH